MIMLFLDSGHAVRARLLFGYERFAGFIVSAGLDCCYGSRVEW